jgi:hypothetical protein
MPTRRRRSQAVINSYNAGHSIASLRRQLAQTLKQNTSCFLPMELKEREESIETLRRLIKNLEEVGEC